MSTNNNSFQTELSRICLAASSPEQFEAFRKATAKRFEGILPPAPLRGLPGGILSGYYLYLRTEWQGDPDQDPIVKTKMSSQAWSELSEEQKLPYIRAAKMYRIAWAALIKEGW